MEHHRTDIPLKVPVDSLCWRDDSLVDWVGGRAIDLSGRVSKLKPWGYRFDAAVQSPSGRYSAIYERLGTKAVVLDQGKFVRELNRSFDDADTYEYPIVLFSHPDGRDLVAHCPDKYNCIEIDEVATGKRLTGGTAREGTSDFYHSRLAVSPDGRRLLSAGWIWHPFNSASTWLIDEALADGCALDSLNAPEGVANAEINGATFIDANWLLVNSSPDADEFGDRRSPFGAGCLGVLDLESRKFESVVKVDETVGTMLWLGHGHVVGFYGTPKVFDLRTGKAIFRWPDIDTGKQDSSIIHHLDPLPKIALDPVGRRFAVAAKDRIAVVQFPRSG